MDQKDSIFMPKQAAKIQAIVIRRLLVNFFAFLNAGCLSSIFSPRILLLVILKNNMPQISIKVEINSAMLMKKYRV